MYRRQLQSKLIQLAERYPIVTITGPRQAGKSTLVRASFKDKPYVNLEALDLRAFARSDPRAFLGQYPEGAILDEIQHLPELLSYIQVIVDEQKKPGLFVLTGSQQLLLHQGITQSLAGRTALLTLYPLSLAELREAGFTLTTDLQMIKGGYPRVYESDLDPVQTYRDYYLTYVQRDVRDLLNIKNLNLFDKFIRLCAGRIGSVFEASSLANEVGVSSHTIQEWLSVLEASYLIFRLYPYFENLGKRLIKSPKLYFTDLGMACYLLGIEQPSQLNRDPLRGALFENLVILELMKYRYNQGLDANMYFYRDQHQHEVDLIYKSGHQLLPIEIKSAQTFHPEFLKNLHYFQKVAGDRAPTGLLLYAGDQSQLVQGIEVLNYEMDCAEYL